MPNDAGPCNIAWEAEKLLPRIKTSRTSGNDMDAGKEAYRTRSNILMDVEKNS